MSTSATSSPAITFSGLGSGIDTASIVAALMKIERQPIDRITTQKSAITAKQGVVQEINGLLTALRDAAAKMYSLDAFEGKTASSADASVVTASAGASAPTGTYNVVVSALAQAHTAASTAGPALTPGSAPGHHRRRADRERRGAGGRHPPDPGRPHQRDRGRRRLGERRQRPPGPDRARERRGGRDDPRRHRRGRPGLHHHPARPGRRRHHQRPARDQHRQRDHRGDQRA